jgi:hypothetical protein
MRCIAATSSYGGTDEELSSPIGIEKSKRVTARRRNMGTLNER